MTSLILYPKAYSLNYNPPKRYYVYGPRDCYRNFYKKQHPQSKLTTNNYSWIVYTFFNQMLKYLIRTKLSFYMPNGLGKWSIIYKKRKSPHIDLYNTLRLNKPIYVLNLHINGTYPSLKWEDSGNNRYRNKAYTSLEIHTSKKKYIKRKIKALK